MTEPASADLTPIDLTGEIVCFEPLTHDHAAGLVEAVQDGELWKLWYTAVLTPEGMVAEIDRRLARQDSGLMVSFATRDLRSGKLIGMTSYMAVNAALPRVEIGSNRNTKSTQVSGTNAES